MVQDCGTVPSQPRKAGARAGSEAIRWNAILQAAKELNPIGSDLTVRLEENSSSSDLGYKATRKLLHSRHRFTKPPYLPSMTLRLSARSAPYESQRSAFLSMWSVVGFHDIQNAAYLDPGLTTVRQPLRKMGKLAAENGSPSYRPSR